jgi:hypothetical protein
MVKYQRVRGHLKHYKQQAITAIIIITTTTMVQPTLIINDETPIPDWMVDHMDVPPDVVFNNPLFDVPTMADEVGLGNILTILLEEEN